MGALEAYETGLGTAPPMGYQRLAVVNPQAARGPGPEEQQLGMIISIFILISYTEQNSISYKGTQPPISGNLFFIFSGR